MVEPYQAHPSDDGTIVQLLVCREEGDKEGEEVAVHQLIDHHIDWLQKQAKAFARTSHLPEDEVLSEVVAEAINCAYKYNGTGTFPGWVVAHMSSVERRLRDDQSTESLEVLETSKHWRKFVADIDLEADQLQRRSIEQALRYLPVQQAEVLSRYYLAAAPETLSSIAKTLDMSATRVHQLKNEALNTLRSPYFQNLLRP